MRFPTLDFKRILLAGTLCLLGCDATPEPEAPALPPAPAGSATVRGTVRFVGKPPEMRQIENQGCHTAAGPIFDETVVVGADGALQNVIVAIEGLPGGPFDGSKRPPAMLDQKSCAFAPHVVAVQVRQPLRISSSDPTAHNVHYVPSKNKPENLSFKSKGEATTVSFDHAEVIRTKCDVHPWMTAYVGVFDHPFFAVTDAEGKFEITGLPPGTYKLVAWQELLGTQEQTIEVHDAAAAEVNFEYAPPQ